MLEAERLSKDLNFIRSNERLNKTKAVYQDNLRLQDMNLAQMENTRSLQNDNMRDGRYGKTGDIFDSMFERQQHWRNVRFG